MNANRVRAALFLLSATLVASLPAQTGDVPHGKFDGPAFDGKRVMHWTFLRKGDGVSVSATIKDAKGPTDKKNPRILGLGGGRDVKVNGNVVEFTLAWSGSHMIQGPKDAKYVAEFKGDKLVVKWTAGDEKGELEARNPNPPLAKKGDKKGKAGGTTEKVLLASLLTDKGVPATVKSSGTVTQLGIVRVGVKSSKAEYVKVTKDTKFVVIDGDEKKTYDHKTVVGDVARWVFFNREITLERDGSTAVVVTGTAPKEKK